jgi:hypothetical protein
MSFASINMSMPCVFDIVFPETFTSPPTLRPEMLSMVKTLAFPGTVFLHFYASRGGLGQRLNDYYDIDRFGFAWLTFRRCG